jgi:hypothetical protein
MTDKVTAADRKRAEKLQGHWLGLIHHRAIPHIAEAMAVHRLAAEQPALGWRGIECAPRDGTEFIGWSFNVDRPECGGNWNDRCRFNPDSGAYEIWGRVDYDEDGWDCLSYLRPTHWMPDLAAPEAIAEQPTRVDDGEVERLSRALRDAADTFDKMANSMREEDADLLAVEIAVAVQSRDQCLAALAPSGEA